MNSPLDKTHPQYSIFWFSCAIVGRLTWNRWPKPVACFMVRFESCVSVIPDAVGMTEKRMESEMECFDDVLKVFL